GVESLRHHLRGQDACPLVMITYTNCWTPSGTSVLTNLEGIRDPEELLERETELHLAAYEEMFNSFDEQLTPDLPFFYYLHHMIFARLYVWAGRPRTVGISKGGTPFCLPQDIDAMMGALFAELEK